MRPTTTHETTISYAIGGDTPIWEGEMSIEFTYTPGFAGRGPDMHQPGEPPDPPEVEIVRITAIDGRVTTKEESEDFLNRVLDDDRVYERLIEAAESEL